MRAFCVHGRHVQYHCVSISCGGRVHAFVVVSKLPISQNPVKSVLSMRGSDMSCLVKDITGYLTLSPYRHGI